MSYHVRKVQGRKQYCFSFPRTALMQAVAFYGDHVAYDFLHIAELLRSHRQSKPVAGLRMFSREFLSIFIDQFIDTVTDLSSLSSH